MVTYPEEGLYIAGPECFYENGYELWWAERKLAEFYGIPVVIPTSTPLKGNAEDLRDNAFEIFNDLVEKMKATTAIIADLEFFRGSEPDGGTIFEMGWLWAKGGSLYAFSRDCRIMAAKKNNVRLSGDKVVDYDGRVLGYPDLPFCPSISASTKIIEGDFTDALKLYMVDLVEKRKHGKMSLSSPVFPERISNRVFIATSKRYDEDYAQYRESVRSYYKERGYEAVFPGDNLDDLSDIRDPYARAVRIFDANMTLLLSSSSIVADLDGYHGFEPNNDVSFECGVAFGAGLKCIAFISDGRIMRERIPHRGSSNIDWAGNTIENFNMSVNLMFGCCFNILEGDAISALSALA